MDVPDDAIVMSRVEIVRWFAKEPGEIVMIRARDGTDEDLPLIETLGLLRMGEHLSLTMARALKDEAEEEET